jgi:nucleotide-binding universal stress UspA family protein
MRWIIGLDLRPRSFGALHFASWLDRTTGGADEFAAVHVLEPEHLRAALKYGHMDEVVAAARASGEQILAREAAGSRVRELEILSGVEAPDGLAEALSRRQADALVVGRIAATSDVTPFRLGRVARRLVGAPPAPVVVVPPDLAGPDFGAGPILALTGLDENAREACRFAKALAVRTGRRLVVLHVVSEVELPFLQDPTLEAHARERWRDAGSALAAWVAQVGLEADEVRVEQGDILARADAVAKDTSAALLVVGAPHHVGLDRLTSIGLGRELAATARLPVAVVPPRR